MKALRCAYFTTLSGGPGAVYSRPARKIYARHKHVDLSASRRSPLSHQKMKDRTMLQHYSVSWKKGLLHSAYWLLLGLAAAIKKRMRCKSGIRRTFEQPTAACRCQNHTVTMLVQINGRFLTDDTRTVLCLKMAPTDINRCLWVMHPESIL